MGLTRFYPGYKQDVTAQNSVVCMEATGVYGQALAYFLVTHKYRVSVEPPLKVKRAFPTHGHKNDITDSEHLAEYAYRFYDELHIWKPPNSVLEHLKTLLRTREQLTKNKTGYRNSLIALRREIVRTQVAEKMYENLIEELKSLITKIDSEIKVLLDKKIDQKDLELFYTSVENPIYEFLNPGQEGRWGSMDGESLLDHAYYMGSNLKIWEWRKREQAETVMDELLKTQKK